VITNPRPLSGLEALALCLAGVVVVLGILARRGRIGGPPSAVAWALLASVLATAPVTLYSVVHDAAKASGYSSFLAARVGPQDNGVDTAVVDRAKKLVPAHTTYAILLAPHADPAAAGAFRVWTLTAFLPRIATEDVARARWFVSFGGPPSAAGVTARDVRRIRSAEGRRYDIWVGRAR
jgi:hypothetical protein